MCYNFTMLSMKLRNYGNKTTATVLGIRIIEDDLLHCPSMVKLRNFVHRIPERNAFETNLFTFIRNTSAYTRIIITIYGCGKSAAFWIRKARSRCRIGYLRLQLLATETLDGMYGMSIGTDKGAYQSV